MASNLILIALGGALGAVSRYLIGLTAQKILPYMSISPHFPLATLSVNLIGAFLLGAIMELLARHFAHLPTEFAQIRAAIAIGYLGSLTTFSTMMLDIVALGDKQDWITLGFYLGISLAGGIICFLVGMRLAIFLGNLMT